MLLKLFAKTKTFALDINSQAINLLAITRERKRFSTCFACSQPLPSDTVVAGKIIDWQKLQIALKELVIEHKLAGLHVILHLPAIHLRMNVVTLPLGFSGRLIEKEIQRHVAQEIPGLQEPLIVDYALVNKDDNKNLTYSYAVTKQSYVTQYRRLISDSGLNLSVIDIDIYALVRVLFASMSLHQWQSATIHHAFVITQQSAYLIVFTATHILLHYHWEINDSLHMQQQLQAKLQTCMAALNKKISCLIIIANQNYQDAIIKVCSSLNIMTEIERPINIFNNHANHISPAQSYNFLIAMGLALRML